MDLTGTENKHKTTAQINSVTQKKQTYYNSHHYNGRLLLSFEENLMVNPIQTGGGAFEALPNFKVK